MSSKEKKKAHWGWLIAVFVFFVVVIISFSPENDVAQENKIATIDVSSLYSIVSDKSNPPHNRKVEAVLNDRFSASQLTAIAENIKASGTDAVDLTLIGYRLNTASSNNSIYWATTHYMPELQLTIQGLTKEELQKIDSRYKSNNYQLIVGSWLYDAGLKYLKVFYIKDGKLFSDEIFQDGLNTSQIKILKQKNRTIRLKSKYAHDDEYYTVDNDGNLLEWAERGNYMTTPPYDKNKINVKAISEL